MALILECSSVSLRDLLQVWNLWLVKHSPRIKFSPFFLAFQGIDGWMHDLPFVFTKAEKQSGERKSLEIIKTYMRMKIEIMTAKS